MEKQYKFNTWYEKSFSRFVTYTNRRVKNKQLAEDITSDIMLKIFVNYDAITSPDAYFFTSVKRAITNIIDKDSRHCNLDAIEPVTYKYQDGRDPLYIMEENQIETEFNNVISMLPPEERDIYMSYRTKELTTYELEDHFNISRKHLYKIIHHVNSKLAHVFPDQFALYSIAS